MKWNRLTRRHFLQGAGASLALPLLPSLLSRRAEAQTATPQKSFIAIAAFNGLYRLTGPTSDLMPPLPSDVTGAAGLTATTPTGLHTIHSAPLMSLASGGQISTVIDSSFNAMLPKMQMLMGLDYIALGWIHHHGHFGDQAQQSTSAPINPVAMATLDQVLANSPSFYQNASLLGRSLAYTANNGETGSGYQVSSTYQNPAQPATSPIVPTPVFFDPQAVWDKFFGSFTQTGPNLKQTLVDRVMADYTAVRNGPRISAADRTILDEHVAFLQAAEQQVQANSGCSPGTRPAGTAPSGAPWGAGLYGYATQDTQADRVALMQTMNTVIASLIACGLCNSFLGSANSLTSVNPDDWHTWSHHGYDNDGPPADSIADPASYASLINDNSIVMKTMCLDLAQKLDAIKPDGVHSLLDNSLIACVQEHSKRGHQTWGVPVITFGSAGGVFNTGQYIDYRNMSSGDDLVYTRYGFPINQLWANWLQAMGMTPAEYEALNTSAAPNFTLGSRLTGYGVSAFGDPGFQQNSYNNPGWASYDLSSWMPLIHT